MNISKEASSLEDNFLDSLRNQEISVAIYLANGIKLRGIIKDFDEHIILLRSPLQTRVVHATEDASKKSSDKLTESIQMIYKASISTVLPLYSAVHMHDN